MSTGGIHMGRVRPRWRSRLTVLLAFVIITWRVLYSGVAGGHLYWDFFHVGHCLCRLMLRFSSCAVVVAPIVIGVALTVIFSIFFHLWFSLRSLTVDDDATLLVCLFHVLLMV